MSACNYIDVLYTQIQNTYEGTPIDFSVLEEAITPDVINLVITPVLDNTYTTDCTLNVQRNICNTRITIL